MHLNWIIWTVFCSSVSGAILSRIQGNEKKNDTKNTISSSHDDYDTNYPDYPNRDYPSLDYYNDDDNRDGRSFNHDDHSSADDGGNFDEQDAEDFMIKQLKSTIPGTPGVDYALYQSVPETSFRCETQMSPGFYGDVEAQCQVFHICQEDDRQDSFLCPLGTVFNQISFICDWWFNFNCEDAPTFYHLNSKLDSTGMKNTMKRMENFQNNDMHKMMGLAKINRKMHNVKHMMRNTGSAKLSKSPIKNLFMIRMRRKMLDNIRNTITVKREAENTVTALPVIRTPLVLEAMSSTGNFDVALSENTTSILLDSFREQSTPEPANDSTRVNNLSTTPSAVLNSTFEPLKLPTAKMLTNESAFANVKLNRIEIANIETSTIAEFLPTIHMNMFNKSKNINLPETKNRTKSNEENQFESNFELKYSSKLNIEIPANETIMDNNNSPKFNIDIPANETIMDSNNSQRNDVIEDKSRPTILPLSKPFSHENKFIIGNDTHISVSVTIHSNSGNSKLLWKRLPGLKRIRKIRIKDENANSTYLKQTSNDAIYRRKNEQKSRSRIMWIPAKQNTLDRKLNWRRYSEPRNADVIVMNNNPTKNMQIIKELQKAALESTEFAPIAIKDSSYENLDAKSLLMNKSREVEPLEESNTVRAFKYIETDISLATTTEENFQKLNETSDFSNSNLEDPSEIQTNPIEHPNTDSENENNCKTICIKLLKSLDRTLLREFENVTDFENSPSSTFLSNESSHMQNNDEYKRESILQFLPSEQWTLKYDSGPNCSENTENDKILVKGWSVIVDIGSITKEKTVKRRECARSSSDKRITLKNLNFGGNSKDENEAFNMETPQFAMNSNSRFGSADQRYWINLVRNWLSQSQSNNNQGISSKKRDGSQNIFSNHKQIFDNNSNLKSSTYQDQIKIRSEHLHQDNLPNKHQAHFNRNFEVNSEIESKSTHVKDSVEDPLSTGYNRRQQQNARTNWFSDLQTERSEWSQATRRRQDNLHAAPNNRNPSRFSKQDAISDEIDDDEDRLSEIRRDGPNNFENSHRNRNSWISENQNSNKDSNMHNHWTSRSNRDSDFTDQDYDGWSSQEKTDRNWMNSRRDEESHANSKGRDWSENKNKKKSTASPDRRVWNTEQKGEWLNNKPIKGNQNKGLQTGFVDRTNDWLFNNRNEQSSSSNDQPPISWRQDFDRKLPEETHRARPPNSMHNTKGTSIRHESRMPQNEEKFLKENHRKEWSLMKPRDTNWSDDKKVSRRNDRTSDSGQNKASLSPSNSKGKHFQTSKNDKGIWSTDKENSWGVDSEPKWIMENQKGDEERKKPTSGHGRGIMKNGWHTEEKTFKREENVNKPLNEEWNFKGTVNKNTMPPDRDIKSSNTPDWSSRPRSRQNKGSKERPIRPPQKHPSWVDDEDDNGAWSEKSPTEERWPSQHALHRSNFKGSPDFPSNQPRTTLSSQKPWSSNDRGGKWKDDEETRISNSPANRPPQKQKENPSLKPRTKNPQWKSDAFDSEEWLGENEKRTRNVPSNSKGAESPKGSSRSNDGTARNRMTDWRNKSWKDHITLTKDIKVEDRSSYQPRESRGNRRNEKPDAKDSTLSGYGRASQKPNVKNYWGSSKDIKGNRSPGFSYSNDNDQSKSAKPRKTNIDEQNFDSNNTDSETKKIVWSVQISSDGKLGNGWVPITLHPDRKNRVNGSHTGSGNKRTSFTNDHWNDEGDSSNHRSFNDKERPFTDESWNDKDDFPNKESWKNEDLPKDEFVKNRGKEGNSKGNSRRKDNRNRGDFSSEDSFFSDDSWNFKDVKATSWNSEESKNDQNMQIAKYDEITEINPVYSQEESFNQLIYVPAKNIRYKRSHNSKGSKIKTRDAMNKSYLIIKNGKILNDSLNKAYISRGDIKVQNDRDYNKSNDVNLTIQVSSFQNNNTRTKQNNSKFDPNKFVTLNRTKVFRSDAIYEANAKHDRIATESALRDIWSSPLLATNFSTSGWIPVTTFKSSSSKNLPNPNKSYKIINVTHFQSKTDESSLSTSASIQVADRFITADTSKNLSAVLTEDSDVKNKGISKDENDTSTVKSENMKVGNKTLRILSFSEVMKHFQIQGKPTEDHKPDNISWNKPITINPKTYSLKLVDPPKETIDNISNSWIFSSNDNSTKKSWLLINSGESLEKMLNDSKENRNPESKESDVRKITNPVKDHQPNSTLSFSGNKTVSDNIPKFKFTNWNSNSDWAPIIRTVGRVVSYNRTLLQR